MLRVFEHSRVACAALRLRYACSPSKMRLQLSEVPRPTPCYLDEMDNFGVRGGRRVWRNPTEDRLYTWDGLHGEIEAFTLRGRHVGALHAVTGAKVKDAVRGRKIDV